MELRVFKNLFNEPALLCLGITFFFWWTGFGERDLYLLPALIFLSVYIYRIWINKPLNIPVSLKMVFYMKKWLIIIFLFM